LIQPIKPDTIITVVTGGNGEDAGKFSGANPLVGVLTKLIILVKTDLYFQTPIGPFDPKHATKLLSFSATDTDR